MKRTILGLALAASVAIGSQAGANIIDKSANVDIIAPPASVAVNALESDTLVRAFQEKTNVVLADQLLADITVAGSSLSPAYIPKGTVVSSWFFSTDPVRANVKTYEGYATFSSEIIGVIIRDGSLDMSDGVVGNPGTTYPYQVAYRGYEFGENDKVTLSNDRRTIRFHAVTSGVVDEFRVLTAPAPVPEPATIMLASMGLSFIGFKRRRR